MAKLSEVDVNESPSCYLDGCPGDGLTCVHPIGGTELDLDLEAPALLYLGTDGSVHQLDRGSLPDDEREQAILDGLVAYVVTRLEDARQPRWAPDL